MPTLLIHDATLIDGTGADALGDIAVLADAVRIPAVVKAGEVVKDLDAQASGGDFR